jgi:hypothetical protein
LVNDEMSAAVVEWTGEVTPTPARDGARLLDRFGEEIAISVIPRLQELEDEFYRSDARHHVARLPEMSLQAASDFRALHPNLSEAAVRALAWCYANDSK